MARRLTALKKASPNGELMVYLRCRDYASTEEPIGKFVRIELIAAISHEQIEHNATISVIAKLISELSEYLK
jgi:hypothetical protein